MLRYVEDLWSPLVPCYPPVAPPKNHHLCKTTVGVHETMHQFVERHVATRDLRVASSKVTSYHNNNVTYERRETFRDGLLHIAGLTTDGFLVAVVVKGGAIQSIEFCKHGSSVFPVRADHARDMFKRGIWVVVVDLDGQMSVTIRAWDMSKQLELAPACSLVPASLSKPDEEKAAAPEAALAVCERALQARALVTAARQAVVNGTWG